MARPLKRFVIAVIIAALGLALTTQVPGPAISVDDSLSTVVALQKKLSDDSDDPDGSADSGSPIDALVALLTGSWQLPAALTLAASWTDRPAVPVPPFFLQAVPRAPPFA